MTKMFYRYIRPVLFDEGRMEFVTQPRGGICLRFEADEGGALWFTYARCHPEDVFSKGAARQIADHRAAIGRNNEFWRSACNLGFFTEDTDTLVELIVSKVGRYMPAHTTSYYFFMATELTVFADALNMLVTKNKQEKQKGAMWVTATKALQLANLYEEISR